MKTALINGNVIDGTGGPPRPDCTVVIEGSKVVEVSRQREFGSEVQIIDVSGKTVMPGLIDCHQHFAPKFMWLISEQANPLMYLASEAVHAMKGCLEAGCTTARDMGGLEVGFVRAQAEGLISGPRLQSSLVIIQPANGLTDNFPPSLGSAVSPQGLQATAPGIPLPWCNGPWEARAKVREVLRYGADVIKVANSDIDNTRVLFTQEELDAIVDEAHRAGVPVGCHAHTPDSAMMAIRAGVDSIEEGCLLDETCVAEMAKRGTWYVPCLSNPHWWLDGAKDPDTKQWAQTIVDGNRRAFILSMQAGVPIAMGTDSGYAVGEAALEPEWMVEAGMKPLEAIAVSTGRAAEFLGLKDKIGTVETGKEADLLVLDGDPLKDIAVLSRRKHLSLVMQAGKPVAGPLVNQFPWSPSAPHRYLL